jgi:predicted MFS family arabinose efflux permease
VACFVVSAISYLPFIGVAVWILPRRGARPPATEAAARTLKTGIADVLRQPQQRDALLTVLVTGVLCAPLVTFSPVLVREVFHGDAGQFSTAVASFGVGGLLGAVALLAVAPGVDRRRLSAGVALACGATLVLTALDPWPWGLPPLLVLAGASMTISNTAANTVLQATANPRLLGQTVSLYMLAMRGGISVGALLTGVSVDLLGIRRALLVNGILATVIQAALWLRRRAQIGVVTDGTPPDAAA